MEEVEVYFEADVEDVDEDKVDEGKEDEEMAYSGA